MKRIIQIVLLLLLISGNAFGQKNINCPMDILVFDKSPKHNIKLYLTSPESKEVWNADSKTNKVLDSNNTSIEISVNNWYSVPGDYYINVESSDKHEDNVILTMLDFALNGKEINIIIQIYLTPSAENPELLNAFFYIEKRYNSSDSVILIERWKPTPNGNPTYTIINNSSVKIYDTYRNNFYGYIMKFESGEWEVYQPKDDLNYVRENPLQSGDSITSVEKPFVGKVKEFTPGRYKFCVDYTHSDYDYALFRKRNHMYNVVDIYILEKEFTIE